MARWCAGLRACDRLNAEFTSAMCDSAWGKLPSCRRAAGSYTPPTSTVPTSSTTSATTGSTTGSTTGVPTTGGTHLAPGVGPDEPVGVEDPMTTRAADDPADDLAGASPDEALADAVEEPHDVTTPDDPADVVDVESDTKK